MTNCNYSEHDKIQRKEIQKQIEELQAKLEELEKQEPQMTLDKSGDIDAVSYNHKYYYRIGFSSTGHRWLVRNIGDTALYLVQDPETLVKLEQLYEDMTLDTGGVEEPEENEWKNVALKFGEKLASIGPCGYYGYTPDEWFEWAVNTYEKLADDWLILLNKEKQLRTLTEKLQKKDWKVDVKTDMKPHWEPTPQEPEEVTEGLKEAFREAVKQGVVSSNTEPQSLYDCIANWWDEIFVNGNPSGQNIESLVEQIVKLLPDEVNDPSYGTDDWDIAWNQGYNVYRDILIKKFNGK